MRVDVVADHAWRHVHRGLARGNKQVRCTKSHRLPFEMQLDGSARETTEGATMATCHRHRLPRLSKQLNQLEKDVPRQRALGEWDRRIEPTDSQEPVLPATEIFTPFKVCKMCHVRPVVFERSTCVAWRPTGRDLDA